MHERGERHPHVVAAANRQNETLQHSTTIYLQPNIALYAEKLAAKRGKFKGNAILAHKLGRAVYFMLKNKEPFNMQKFLR